jgi:hypothetical protein
MWRLRALAATLALTATVATAAKAAQTVKLSTSFQPDRLGASTTILYSFQVDGTRGALPSAVTDIDLHLPAGMGLATSTLGLATCEPSVLLRRGPAGCPANARVGYGSALVQVPFAEEVVQESASIVAMFGPPEEEHLIVLFYVEGVSPIYAQLVFPGAVLPDSGAFGERLDTGIPVIPAVPEGPDVAVVHFTSTIGPRNLTYYRRIRGKNVPFQPRGIAVPQSCPHGGFPFAADFAFADGTHTHAKSTVPCPRASAGRRGG